MTLQDLGQLIREKREASGLSIEDIAGRIKISGRSLRAIENGTLEGLPHAVYTKGFVRSFGLAVGLDPAELNESLSRAFPPEAFDDARPEPGPLSRPLTPPGMGKKVAALVLAILILVGLGAGGWYVVSTYGDEISKKIKQTFSAVKTTPEPAKTSTASPQTTPAGSLSANSPSEFSSQSSAARSTPQPTPQIPVPAAPQPVETTFITSSSDAAPTQTPQEEATPAIQQVQISARAPCWVGSKADGGTGKQHTMKAGEDFTLTFKKSIVITLTNPAEVEMTLNGKPYKFDYATGKRAKITIQ